MKRYSQMTSEELKKTISELEGKLSEARANKLESEAEISQQKIYVAKSYLIDPQTIEVNSWYQIEGVADLFQVEYLNGIYAWGKLERSSNKEAFPLSLLKQQKIKV